MELYKKISLQAGLALLGVISLSLIFYSLSYSKRIQANQREKIELLSEIISSSLRNMMIEGRGKEFQKFLETLVAEDVEAIRIIAHNGTILISSVPGEVGKTISEAASVPQGRDPDWNILTGARNGKEVFSKMILIKNDLICMQCHSSGEAIRGILDVEMSATDPARNRIFKWNNETFIIIVAIITFMAAICVIVYRGLNVPLKRIIDTLNSSGVETSKPRLGVRRSSELEEIETRIGNVLNALSSSKEEVERCKSDKDRYTENMASVGAIAATVAHEIKNPLAGISGALQVLAEDFPEQSPRREIAQEILKEIERLDMAVKDLLLFTRPPDLNLIPTNICAVIDRVSRSLVPLAASRDVKINWKSDNIFEIMIDPDQIEKAIHNIAVHSLQALHDGGELRVAVSAMSDSSGVEIVLEDNGRGMPDEKIKDFFMPFFSTKNTGTGLGLAISRNIIEAHNGRISVESSPGRGSIFRIFLTGESLLNG